MSRYSWVKSQLIISISLINTSSLKRSNAEKAQVSKCLLFHEIIQQLILVIDNSIRFSFQICSSLKTYGNSNAVVRARGPALLMQCWIWLKWPTLLLHNSGNFFVINLFICLLGCCIVWALELPWMYMCPFILNFSPHPVSPSHLCNCLKHSCNMYRLDRWFASHMIIYIQ